MYQEIAKEAYREVEFYKRKLSSYISEEDGVSRFSDLPLLEKNEVVPDSLELMAPQYIMGLYRDEYICANTSGSTGKCLKVYWRHSDCMRSMYSLWFYRRKFYGVNTWDKKCQFFTISQVGGDEPKSILRGNNLDFSKSNLTEERLVEIYHQMQEFQPVWLLLQPCIAELLCIVKRKFRLPQIESVCYIEMTGEWLTDSLRELIKTEFQCVVANQYGANEVNSIAYECPEGNLHCMESNVYVEILDDDGLAVPYGDEGNIYVTTCHNHAMPFIRYGIGDRGVLKENICNCGHKGKILQLKSGRSTEWIQMKNGKKVNPYVFIRAIEAVNILYENCILQYKITQMDYDHFEVDFAVDEITEDLYQCFIQNIGHDELKNCNYDFHLYEELFPEQTGKRNFFKSNIANLEEKNEFYL